MLLLRLIERNLKLYYRDVSGVFFSLLSVIMIIFMYAVFLGQNQIDNLRAGLGNIAGIDGLVIAWVMSGILCVSTITVPISALGVLVEDRNNRIIGDFYTSPIDRKFLVLSYLISATVITTLVSMVNLVVGQIYLAAIGADLLGFIPCLLTIALIIFSSFIFSTIFFYIALSIRSVKAFGSLAAIVGTLVGFFGGIYLPIGVMSPTIQTFVNILPIAHSATLFRQVYMVPYLEKVFTGAPISILEEYRDFSGLDLNFASIQLAPWHMILVLTLVGILFYLLSMRQIKKAHFH